MIFCLLVHLRVYLSMMRAPSTAREEMCGTHHWQVTLQVCVALTTGKSHCKFVWHSPLASHSASLFGTHHWQVTLHFCVALTTGKSHCEFVWHSPLASHTASLCGTHHWQVTLQKFVWLKVIKHWNKGDKG